MNGKIRKGLKSLGIAFLISIPLSYLTHEPVRNLMHFANTLLTGKEYGRTYLDESGVPWTEYGVRGGNEVGKRRNASRIGMAGLDHLAHFEESNDPQDLKKAQNCMQWLVENAIPIGDGLGYQSEVGRVRYQIPQNYRSALWQARGINLALALEKYEGTGKRKGFIRKLLLVFRVPVDSGGVTYKDAPDAWWYEEFASPQGQHPRVLNGNLSALISLKNYARQRGDSLAADLLNRGLKGLKRLLPEFDIMGHTYYDLLGNSPESVYHQSHWQLLLELNEGLNDPLMSQYASRWKSRQFLPLQIRTILIPNKLEFISTLIHLILGLLLFGGFSWLKKKFKKA